MKKIERIWEAILDKLDGKVSVTTLAKPEDLVISNAPLKNIQKGIRKVYREVYGNVDKDLKK